MSVSEIQLPRSDRSHRKSKRRAAAPFAKSRPMVGARPGTLAIPADSPAPRIFVVQYGADHLREAEIVDDSELEEFAAAGSVTWIDIRGLGNEQRLRAVAAAFGLHDLVLEDAVNIPQRAKTVLWERQQVVIARTPLLDHGDLAAPQVCFVLGRNVLLSFQERYFGFFDPVRERIRAGIGPIRTSGPDYLLYALIDTLIDHHYPVVEQQAAELDRLHDDAVEKPVPSTLSELHDLRRQLALMRRIGWPQRELLAALMRDPSPFIADGTRVYLRTTYDHMAQIIELVDSSRDMATAVVEIYLSNISQRTNEIMKVLTMMASLFIPLSFIAGVYGMNFDHMPELHQIYGYPLVLALMGSAAGAMLTYFWRKGWFGTDRQSR